MSGTGPARRLADTFLGLYPRAWRDRYGDELSAFLDEHRVSPATLVDLSRGAIDAHRHPELLRRETDVMSQDPSPEKRFTRRRLLIAAGGGAIGVVAAGIIGLELERNGAANSTATLPSASATPSSSPVLLSVASSSPEASASSAASPALASAPATVAGPRASFRTRPDLTPPIVSIVTPAAASVAPGFVFYTPANGAKPDGPAIVDNAGELVWSRPDNGIDAVNLGVAQYKGQPVLYWWEGANNHGVGAGALVIADASYREITRVKVAGGRTADLHEFLITSKGTALFFADQGVVWNDPATGQPLPYQVLDCAVQEVDIATGRLLFEWHTVDHIAIDETFIAPPTGPNQIFDYVHGNSIDVDADGNLLVSARNTSAVYKVDHASGEILWRLGGRKSDFAMGEGTTFQWQHHVRRQADGTLSIFDDANTNSPPPKAGPTMTPAASSSSAAQSHPSRGIFLNLDETAKTATLVRQYLHPKPLFATSQGDVQVLANGNVFIGWGSTPWFTEFAADGTVIFDATFPAAVQSYRDYRFPWVGQPVDAPAIAFQAASGGNATVYASWNGATEVAMWEVLSGDSAEGLAAIGSGARTGFETSISVSGAKSLVAVRAHDRTGKVLGTSAPIGTAP
ncbi:MAG TPA: arylsulfotransferase family protein [Candidatus Saccharimonadales bacterium]|nr:arylsulfotransferase family protein [Candidatus Saccharimonadales bacterium]